MTQKGLIKKILAAAQMSDCNPNWTPASVKEIGADVDGEPMDEPWNYRSIVGMLLYLSTNTRPDISMAVSQVARFCNDPKQSHATAVKMILRYLKRTCDKGMIMRPNNKLILDCYVDAAFAGLYKIEPDSNPDAARSRYGYVIMFGDCPLIWKSSLLSQIVLSTAEAEYGALQHAMRIMIPLRRLIVETINRVQLTETLRATLHCRVFEDNAACLILATQQRITNRTRYWLNSWHWFWSHVNPAGPFEVLKIDTHQQRADYQSKPLGRELFENNRFLVQGW